MKGELLFEAEGLELRYGAALALALSRLELAEGERLALLGPNGSGKTSLLKALNGLVRPSAGRLDFRGLPAHSSTELRRRSVYLHQHPYILAGSVSYNLRFGCRSRGLPLDQAEERIRDAVRLLDLGCLVRRRHRALSGGEAQRVALARALAAGADLLLLDEPTASADVASRALILEALTGRSTSGSTLVFSTHDPGLARELATRTLVLREETR